MTLLGGAVAGIVNPINPLLEPEQIAAILRETGAKVLVTLKVFPKTDVAQKAAEARGARAERRDGARGRSPALPDAAEELDRAADPAASRGRPQGAGAGLRAELARADAPRSTSPTARGDRVAAYFHTGGTTGMPKVAQHRYSGMIYNGWLGAALLFSETDDT